MIISRLTSKAQTTIPQSVRRALHVEPGDSLSYEIEGERVILTRFGTKPPDDPFALFTEWSSDADERAYRDL